MAKASRRTIVKTVVRLLRDRPEDRSAIVRSLAAYLALHKQTNQLDLFMRDVARELETSEGSVLAEVTSARPRSLRVARSPARTRSRSPRGSKVRP